MASKEYHKQYRLKNKDKAKEYRLKIKDKQKEYMKEYYIKNKTKLYDKNLEYYNLNKDKRVSRMKEYYCENKEKLSLYNKEARIKNKDKLLAYEADYRKNNVDKIKESRKENRGNINYHNSMRQLLKRKASPKWLSKMQKNEIKEIYIKSSNMSTDLVKYHVDHIIPLKGKNVCGLHVPWNLQILESKENIRKGNKLCVTLY